MEQSYYPFWFRFSGQDYYLLWFTNDLDGFIKLHDGFIPWFTDLTTLDRFAQINKIEMDTDSPIVFDLDKIVSWVESPSSESVDCVTFLNSWNFFTDIASTVDKSFKGNQRRYHNIYEKLFWGNNLPSVTPPGERYQPQWVRSEIKAMRNVFMSGLALLREALRWT